MVSCLLHSFEFKSALFLLELVPAKAPKTQSTLLFAGRRDEFMRLLTGGYWKGNCVKCLHIGIEDSVLFSKEMLLYNKYVFIFYYPYIFLYVSEFEYAYTHIYIEIYLNITIYI